MATHGATTHLEAEERGVPTDFFHQTMYRPDSHLRAGLEESLNTIAKPEKPVVDYMILRVPNPATECAGCVLPVA